MFFGICFQATHSNACSQTQLTQFKFRLSFGISIGRDICMFRAVYKSVSIKWLAPRVIFSHLFCLILPSFERLSRFKDTNTDSGTHTHNAHTHTRTREQFELQHTVDYHNVALNTISDRLYAVADLGIFLFHLSHSFVHYFVIKKTN